jgi:uncharacterized protein (TIGR02147 family)
MSIEHRENLGILLINAASPGDALRQCFAYRKAMNPRFSLAVLAKRIGMKSRGTLSQMLQGKRLVPPRLRPSLLHALTEDATLSEYLELLLARNDDLSREKHEEQENKRRELELFLRDRFTRVRIDHGLSLLASDIFCAFDLFGGRPQERDLIRYFGRSRSLNVQKGLALLMANGFVQRSGKFFSKTDAVARFMTLDQLTGPSPAGFLRESLIDAHDQVGTWLARPAESCFGSTTMSVKRSTYESVLKKIKQDVFRYFSELETEEGDMVIRFNMQVYPVRSDDPK